jgi:hypothetical protein
VYWSQLKLERIPEEHSEQHLIENKVYSDKKYSGMTDLAEEEI